MTLEGESLAVGSPAPSPDDGSSNSVILPVDAAARLQRLTAAFHGSIERPRTSPLYRAGLAAVALAMVVLPILYVALAIFAGWGVVAADRALIDSGLTGRALLFGLLTVTVGGGVAVLFMFKPLFAPKPAQPKSYTLARTDEPVLFGFIDHLCSVVHAPSPGAIDAVCIVNAAAGFRRGVLSFVGPDLKLTIGLPLVAGLTLRQFTGVLAHEFGHFSQGTGMRLTYVIRSVNHWFARVVYERDSWDEALHRWAREDGGWIAAIARVAQGAVWITRRVLWALMMCGHFISCFALRQMEYDADECETRVSGSDAFEATSLRMSQLGMASQAAHNQLAETWKERRLVNDLPAFVVARLGTFDSDTLEKIHELALGRTTGFLDTHPADADRIRAARRIDVPGVFDLEAPADVLFMKFEALSREVTRRHYGNMLGEGAEQAKLQSVSQVMASTQADVEAADALRQVFGPLLMPVRALAMAPLLVEIPQDATEALASLRTLIRQMHKMASDARFSMQRCAGVGSRLIELEQQLGVVEVGAEGLGAEAASEISRLRDALRQAGDEEKSAAKAFDQYLQIAVRRLGVAIGLGGCAAVANQLKNEPAAVMEIEPVLTAMAALQGNETEITAIRAHLLRLHGALVDLNSSNGGSQQTVNAIQNAARVLANRLRKLRSALNVPYPFEHAAGNWSLGTFLVESPPSHDDIGEVLQASQLAVSRAVETHVRLLAHVCRLVRRVERALMPDAPAHPLSGAE